MEKEKKVTNKYGFVMAVLGAAMVAVSFFSSGSSRNIFFILGAIILIIGIAVALSVNPVKKIKKK